MTNGFFLFLRCFRSHEALLTGNLLYLINEPPRSSKDYVVFKLDKILSPIKVLRTDSKPGPGNSVDKVEISLLLPDPEQTSAGLSNKDSQLTTAHTDALQTNSEEDVSDASAADATIAPSSLEEDDPTSVSLFHLLKLGVIRS